MSSPVLPSDTITVTGYKLEGLEDLPYRLQRLISWLLENRTAIVHSENVKITFNIGGKAISAEYTYRSKIAGDTGRLK
jgi:hypothetical protein